MAKYKKYQDFHKIIDGIEYKQCRDCLQWLEMNSVNFNVVNSNKDKLNNRCKTCQKIHKNKYYQYYKINGAITGKPRGRKTRKSFNAYEVRGDITVIFIEHKGEIFECFIDTEDLQKLIDLNYSWYAAYYKKIKGYYVCSAEYENEDNKFKSKTILLHKYLTGSENKYVDHKNHNGLDNRKENLRITDNDKNSQNRKSKNSNNKSGYRNVFWNSQREKWQVSICKNYERTIIGFFDDVDEAGRVAEEARQQYYGEFAGKT